MLGKIEGGRRGQERMRWLDGIIDSVDMSLNVSKYGDLVFWGSKITVDGDYSHKIKGLLLQRRKAMTNLDSILKSRDIPC